MATSGTTSAVTPIPLTFDSKSCKEVKDAETTLTILELPKQNLMINSDKKIAKYLIGTEDAVLNTASEERVLMVVGATGAGKTTLINGMINYILGVKWEDTFRFKLIHEATQRSQAKSQTSWISAYTLPIYNRSKVSYNLTIIDTPGFGDTGGIERDKQITHQIKEFFSIPPPGGIDKIHGIGFVTQSSLPRLTHTQKYVFDSILSIFGHDIGDNIFLMTTFADGKKPQVLAAVRAAQIKFHEPGFKFNNSALFADNGDEKNDDEEDEDDSFDTMFWDMGMKSFKAFFKHFGKADTKSLTLTREVLTEREQLEIVIQGLQIRIREAMGKIDQLNQLKDVLKKHETDINDNKNFTYTTKKIEMEKVDISGQSRYVTNCIVCNFTCHDNCAYANDEDKRRCSAMRGKENCAVCTNHCHWSKHCNNPFYFVTKEVKVEGTYDGLKKKYFAAKAGMSHAEAVVAGVERELKDLRHKTMKMVLQAHNSLLRLEEIALKPNPLSQADYIDLLISSEKQEASDGWKHRVEYYQEIRKQAQIMGDLITMKSTSELMAILEPDCVTVLIETEEREQKQGWEQRVEHFQSVLSDLEIRRKQEAPKTWKATIKTTFRGFFARFK